MNHPDAKSNLLVNHQPKNDIAHNLFHNDRTVRITAWLVSFLSVTSGFAQLDPISAQVWIGGRSCTRKKRRFLGFGKSQSFKCVRRTQINEIRENLEAQLFRGWLFWGESIRVQSIHRGSWSDEENSSHPLLLIFHVRMNELRNNTLFVAKRKKRDRHSFYIFRFPDFWSSW